MAKIRKKERNKKEQDGNLPVPFYDNSVKIVDGENAESTQAIEEKIRQQHVNTVLIPKETLFVEESRFEKPHFIIQTILTIIGLGTLIGFIYFSILQHNDSVKALKLAEASSDSSDVATKKSIALTERSVSISESSNTITKQSLELAQRNFRIENRPWIGFKDISGQTLIPNKDNIYQITFQNYGKTPALKVKVIVKYELHTITTFDKFVYPIVGHSTAVIPPNETCRLEKITIDSSFLSSEEYRLLADGTHYLYIFGRVDYTDIFNGADTTYFCFIYDIKSENFRISEKYNTMK